MQRLWVWVAAGLAVGYSGMAVADAPAKSIRPKAKVILVVADAATVGVQDVFYAPLTPSLRPRARPVVAAVGAVAAAPEQMVQATATVAPTQKKGLFGFLRPSKRPEGLAERKLASAGGIRILPGKEAVVSKKGSVCGVPEIKGETLSPISGKVKGCGIKNPVRVTSVAGVRLSTPATINCETATALKSWIKNGVEPVYGKGEVVELTVFASYVCRGRNNKKGAKISEHGRGNAIDIGGLVFADGKSVTVLKNYNKPMRQVYKAACGIFGTTLGPGSDGYHENHLHFDVARHRNGTYCR